MRAATLLGANTVPILRALCVELAEAGVEVEFDEGRDDEATLAAVEAGEVDLLWACGLLTAQLIAEGCALEVVAAPVFAGETEPLYRSMIICRPGVPSLAEALSGRLAVNDFGSWSGWHGFLTHLEALGLDHQYACGSPAVVETGSHLESIAAVADDRADVAAIDSSIWNDLLRIQPRPDVAVVAVTGDWPAPPLSVRSELPATIRKTLAQRVRAGRALVAASSDAYGFMLQSAAHNTPREQNS